MRNGFRALTALLCLAGVSMSAPAQAGSFEHDLAHTGLLETTSSGLDLPIEYHRLDNGLRIVLAEDHSVPTTTVAVYFGVGFRNEPRNRTGFAHLFEHLFFMGSNRMPGENFYGYVSNMGGIANASTRLDFTNYFAVVPSNALQAMLWAEAARMASPALDPAELENQRNVVRNEIYMNVEDQAYGGWTWIDLPMAANENWHNAHNFYGDLSDIEAATVTEAQAFFRDYYRPSNAVLVIAGDFDPAETMGWIEAEFGHIPNRRAPAPIDTSEPRQTQEKFAVRDDPLATQPALAVGYHMPERGTPEYYAMAIIDQILLHGGDARLRQRLVDQRGYSSEIGGGINLLGNAFNYNGPMLWTASLIHGGEFSRDQILADLDLEMERLRTELVTPAELRRARAKLMTDFYAGLENSTRFGLVDLLASFTLFDDDPWRINNIQAGFDEVTPELIQRTAREYLRSSNRTVLEVRPGPARTAQSPATSARNAGSRP